MNTILIITIIVCSITLYYLILDSKLKGERYMSRFKTEMEIVISDPGDEVEPIYNKKL